MKYAIIGNGEGPLRLLRSLSSLAYRPGFIGLQQTISPELEQQYRGQTCPVVTGFETEEQLAKEIADLEIDLIINCFCDFKFVKLLPVYDMLNVHLSPLPRYRGPHPLPWALINGEDNYGVSIHQITAEINAGDIYWREMVPIPAGSSVKELRNLLLDKVEKNMAGFLKSYLNKKITPRPNTESKATWTARRYPQDSQLTEWHDHRIIYRKVMALRHDEEPAYIVMGDQKIYFDKATIGSRTYVGMAAPFLCRVLDDGSGIEAVCADGQTVCLYGPHVATAHLKINDRLITGFTLDVTI